MSPPPTELANSGPDNVVDIGVVGTGGAPTPDRRQHPGPGYWLRQARERRGWSQREAADMLNLSARFLVAMEEETFDKLPAAAFARGYLRAYAKLLNLSGDEIIRRYESVVGDDSDPYFRDLRAARRQPLLDFVRAHPGLIVGALGTLVVVLLLTLAWWGWGLVRQQSNTLEPALDAINGAAARVGAEVAPAAAPANPSGSAPAAVALPPPSPGSDLVPVDAPPSAVAAVPSATPAADSTQPTAAHPAPAASDNATVAAAPTAVGAGSDRVELSVAEGCWVDVRDATGGKVFSNKLAAGASVTVNGTAPFTVVLGNAPGAHVSVNGKPVDVDSNIHGRVATLVVGP